MTRTPPTDQAEPPFTAGEQSLSVEEPPVEPSEIKPHLPKGTDALSIDDVSKVYGAVTAVENATFTVHPGEFHCLAGPNGSGKTTLGRIAVGLTRPSTGTVRGPIDSIGYGFQSPRFYPSLTVRENVVTFCKASSVDPESEWVGDIMDALRLSRVQHQPARDLSGGFQKKLDLAIALAGTPMYIWLDEPLGDLDDVSVSRVVALLDAYTEAGGGVIVSTHNFDAFGTVFTHLTVFLDGVQRDTMKLGERCGGATLHEKYRVCVDELYTDAGVE